MSSGVVANVVVTDDVVGGGPSGLDSSTTVEASPAGPVSGDNSLGLDDNGDTGKWSREEDILLKKAVDNIGARNWKRISTEYLSGKRSDVQCLHRWQKVLKPGLIKGPWTKEEDETIMEAIKSGVTKWSEIATLINGRIGKQCRERWFNHLDPSIKKGGWTEEEDRILVEYQEKLGNRWCEIAKVLPGRSENAVKNRWNSAMRRKFQQKRNKQLAASGNAPKDPAVVAASMAKVPKAVRNNIRLPPEAILVEQPTNRNSVIAAREKIRKHQEQVEMMKKTGVATQPDSMVPYVSPEQLASATSEKRLKSVEEAVAAARASGEAAASAMASHAAANVQQRHPQAPTGGISRASIKQEGASQQGASNFVGSVNFKSPLSGENCGNYANTSGSNFSGYSNKRPLGEGGVSASSSQGLGMGLGVGGLKLNPPMKKRAKKNTVKLTKAVSNLLDISNFEVELMKRKAFNTRKLSASDKLLLHQKTLALIEEASLNGETIHVSSVWSKLTQFVNQNGLTTSRSVEPLNLSININFNGEINSNGTPMNAIGSTRSSKSATKSKLRDLRVQCSLDPSTWTLNGGTPLFGQQNKATTSTPLADMLAMVPNFSGINPSIFSPTPRHGASNFCPTPLNAGFPTPTAADIKRIDNSLDENLFPDSMFLMDSSNLSNALNTSSNTLGTMSPIFRQDALLPTDN